MLIKVKDEEDLWRDTNSGAIISTCESKEYQEYLRKKKLADAKREKEHHQEEEINNLKQDIKEIKELLLKLVQKENGQQNSESKNN